MTSHNHGTQDRKVTALKFPCGLSAVTFSVSVNPDSQVSHLSYIQVWLTQST
ncbi:hypothetical protein BACFIN_06670 [Bacteroides finegoldii DSM 17565]|uniref:Uncharacterized protein n=1 Tax=Bacteroides ovatus (strain ATCC 8483 / DSM 1896 / JCM 5824 / BCRC 10623 / CCUG 4943 / NCTC 11153) TaxID=411476 RepID=A0AAN3D895_BACO1|nr:hypothetical protein BACOVA_02276 [Bacteroides ovatus ATCC 8483]EEX45571.1 hypothetical protein BACFIN_06670 [Bacteroides finegoldii DSM 17565]